MIEPQEFFALVERHLTSPMLDAGYAKIGEYDDVGAPPESGLLISEPGWLRKPRLTSWLRKRSGASNVPVFEVGYEASFTDDEKWVSYYPHRQQLDLISWRDTLEGHADWDVWHDRLVPDEEELGRRLAVLSTALRHGTDGDRAPS